MADVGIRSQRVTRHGEAAHLFLKLLHLLGELLNLLGSALRSLRATGTGRALRSGRSLDARRAGVQQGYSQGGPRQDAGKPCGDLLEHTGIIPRAVKSKYQLRTATYSDGEG